MTLRFALLGADGSLLPSLTFHSALPNAYSSLSDLLPFTSHFSLFSLSPFASQSLIPISQNFTITSNSHSSLPKYLSQSAKPDSSLSSGFQAFPRKVYRALAPSMGGEEIGSLIRPNFNPRKLKAPQCFRNHTSQFPDPPYKILLTARNQPHTFSHLSPKQDGSTRRPQLNHVLLTSWHAAPSSTPFTNTVLLLQNDH